MSKPKLRLKDKYDLGTRIRDAEDTTLECNLIQDELLAQGYSVPTASTLMSYAQRARYGSYGEVIAEGWKTAIPEGPRPSPNALLKAEVALLKEQVQYQDDYIRKLESRTVWSMFKDWLSR